MTTVYVVQADHWDAPGTRMEVCATRADADAIAAALVNDLLAHEQEMDEIFQPDEPDPIPTPETWREALKRLQSRRRGADVWITEAVLRGAPGPDDARAIGARRAPRLSSGQH